MKHDSACESMNVYSNAQKYYFHENKVVLGKMRTSSVAWLSWLVASSRGSCFCVPPIMDPSKDYSEPRPMNLLQVELEGEQS